jgi:hypothetical protein
MTHAFALHVFLATQTMAPTTPNIIEKGMAAWGITPRFLLPKPIAYPRPSPTPMQARMMTTLSTFHFAPRPVAMANRHQPECGHEYLLPTDIMKMSQKDSILQRLNPGEWRVAHSIRKNFLGGLPFRFWNGWATLCSSRSGRPSGRCSCFSRVSDYQSKAWPLHRRPDRQAEVPVRFDRHLLRLDLPVWTYCCGGAVSLGYVVLYWSVATRVVE